MQFVTIAMIVAASHISWDVRRNLYRARVVGRYELLRPLGPDTPVGKYLARKGPGLHHVAYRVDDIDAALARLAEQDVALIDSKPRPGIRNSRVAFVHPRATGSVLTEIVEPAEGH